MIVVLCPFLYALDLICPYRGVKRVIVIAIVGFYINFTRIIPRVMRLILMGNAKIQLGSVFAMLSMTGL